MDFVFLNFLLILRKMLAKIYAALMCWIWNARWPLTNLKCVEIGTQFKSTTMRTDRQTEGETDICLCAVLDGLCLGSRLNSLLLAAALATAAAATASCHFLQVILIYCQWFSKLLNRLYGRFVSSSRQCQTICLCVATLEFSSIAISLFLSLTLLPSLSITYELVVSFFQHAIKCREKSKLKLKICSFLQEQVFQMKWQWSCRRMNYRDSKLNVQKLNNNNTWESSREI